VLLALFLVVLVGLVGLGVDGGSLYLHRRGMQNAADAAAFAGARLVGLGQTSTPVIRAEIDKYATKNYVDNPAVNVTAFYTDNTNTHLGAITSAAGIVPANTTGVEVTTTQQAATFFLPVIGFSNLRVSAVAGARTKLTGAPPKPYNFFAKRSTGLSTSNVIDWSGGGWTIDGIMHSNSDINMSGNNNIINGQVEDVSNSSTENSKLKPPHQTLTPSTNNPAQSTVLPDPLNKTLTDFQLTSDPNYHTITPAGGTAHQSDFASFLSTGSDGKSYLQPGIYYVNGSINFALGLSKTDASSVTFVATGSIAISSPTMNFTPYSQGVVFFANLGNGTPTTTTGFNISGSNGSWSGIAYVPWSNAQVSGSGNTTIAGSVVADTIHVSGSNAHLTANAGFFPQPQAEIILYE
jgi:Flp pilus assembly protein TadG